MAFVANQWLEGLTLFLEMNTKQIIQNYITSKPNDLQTPHKGKLMS